MPIKEFWEEEPNLLWTYRKVYMDKIKFENEKTNQTAWLQGLYFFEALSTAIYNSFGRKEGQPAESYAKEPYDLFNKKSPEEIYKEKQKKLENDIKASLKRGQKVLNNKSE